MKGSFVGQSPYNLPDFKYIEIAGDAACLESCGILAQPPAGFVQENSRSTESKLCLATLYLVMGLRFYRMCTPVRKTGLWCVFAAWWSPRVSNRANPEGSSLSDNPPLIGLFYGATLITRFSCSVGAKRQNFPGAKPSAQERIRTMYVCSGSTTFRHAKFMR